jgi:hypothetical protein
MSFETFASSNARYGANAAVEKRRVSLDSMESGAFWELGNITDHDLQTELVRLLTSGSRTEARVIAHLAEVEERRLHLATGSSSLFDYCRHRLGLSESEAFHRLTAARLGRRFPAIFRLIERRAIHLTGVCLLRDYLTPENHRELLDEASGKTKLQVLEMLARHFPRPDVASTIRKLPSHRRQALAPPPAPTLALPRSTSSPWSDVANDPTNERSSRTQSANSDQSPPVATSETVVEPLSAARYRIQVNASAQLKQKLEHAANLLSHSNPSGDLAVVIERALDFLIERVEKRRFAQTKSGSLKRSLAAQTSAKAPSDESRSAQTKSEGREKSVKSGDFHTLVARRHVPNATKREITARDGIQCTFVGSDGRRCATSRFIQIHHDEPWARGGRETVDNLRMLCAAHNRFLAEQDFGTELVADRIAARGLQRRG